MREMRKSNRAMTSEEALEVFDRAPYVTLSMIRPDGTPYGLPLSIVRKDHLTFYFHCACEGEKIDCLQRNHVISMSAVSKCSPVFEEEKKNFTEHYKSAIALGIVEEVENDDEKIEALRMLCQRFLPKYMNNFEEAISRSLHRAKVMRIRLSEPPVGKCKN